MDSNYFNQIAKAVDVELMQKANDVTDTNLLTNQSGLSQDLADAFIDLVVDESVLLGNVSVIRTNSPSGELAKLDVPAGRFVTRQASENASSSESRTATPSNITFATKKTRSQFDITGEVEEDNIEGPRGRNTILNLLLRHIRNDMEVLAIEGDASVTATDDFSALVKTNDGWNTLTTAANGTHIKSAGSKRVSLTLLRNMLELLPTRYRRDMSRFRYIMSPNTALDLVAEVQGRATSLGDLLTEGASVKPWGIEILQIPLIPETLSVTGTDSTGTVIWLMDPTNFMYFVQRDLQVHQEYIPRSDRTEITAFMRTDFEVTNQDAIVKATNLTTDPALSRFS